VVVQYHEYRMLRNYLSVKYELICSLSNIREEEQYWVDTHAGQPQPGAEYVIYCEQGQTFLVITHANSYSQQSIPQCVNILSL